MHKPDSFPPLADNQCGECTACCDVLGVRELGKPYFARCSHLDKGCGIYETRPDTCRAYRCVWHLGLLGDRPDFRPDKLGILLELNIEDKAGNKIDVFELVPGTMDAKRDQLKHILARIRSNKSMKHAIYAPIWVGFFPFGSAIPSPFEYDPAYAPFAPEPLKMAFDRQKGEATYVGPCHDLLMPKPSP
jgi:hypothetical protein